MSQIQFNICFLNRSYIFISKCKKLLNKKTESIIDRVIKKANDKELSKRDFLYQMWKETKFAGIGFAKDENFKTFSTPLSDSIYFISYLENVYHKLFALGKTTYLNDTYFGVSKFNYFFTRGADFYAYLVYGSPFGDYLQRELSEIELPVSIRDRAINFINQSQRHEHFGYNQVGSYANVAATFQGERFYKDLLGGHVDLVTEEAADPIVVFENGKWIRKKSIDLGKYLNVSFDEGHNCSTLRYMRSASSYCPI